MFERTDTPCAPWTVARSNDKKRGRIAAFRWVLSVLDYPTKDEQVVGQPDPLVVGPTEQGYEQPAARRAGRQYRLGTTPAVPCPMLVVQRDER
jgi:hypothetical protein